MSEPTPPPGQDATQEYEPGESEVHPAAKRLAGRVATALVTYDPDEDLDAVLSRLDGSGLDRDALRLTAEPLHEAGSRSVGEVVYPQMGGLDDDRASVMVVTRQRLERADGETAELTRTLDVRLRRAAGEWVFEDLSSAGGEPSSRPDDLPAVAEAVLDDPRIWLPDSARWDVYRGTVATELLESMLEIAERYPYRVVTLSSGHPHHVFSTDRVSDHTRGLAVDIFEVGGDLVVNQRTETSPAYEVARWLYDEGIGQLGSPWAFDGVGGRSFTDEVHQDHLHVSVTR